MPYTKHSASIPRRVAEGRRASSNYFLCGSLRLCEGKVLYREVLGIGIRRISVMRRDFELL